MLKQRPGRPTTMADRIARALAKADGTTLAADPERYRSLAIAALKTLTVPTETMVNAAHAVFLFDDAWGIDSTADFRRAVRAMITHAVIEGQGTDQ
jgi:hypothetical protein